MKNEFIKFKTQNHEDGIVQTKSKSSTLMYISKLKTKNKKNMDENLYIIEII